MPTQIKILLLPGAGGLNQQFETFHANCAAEMPALLIDYPDWLWQIQNPGFEPLAAETAARVIQAAGPGPAALAGYSIGAYIAIRVAELCRGTTTDITWIAVIDPVMSDSTGLGPKLLARIGNSILTAWHAGPAALFERLRNLLNRATARLTLPFLVKAGPGVCTRIAPLIPAKSRLAREYKLRLMLAAGAAQSRTGHTPTANPDITCHVIQTESNTADSAYWQAHFTHVDFQKIPGTHHTVIENPDLIIRLKRLSQTPHPKKPVIASDANQPGL